MRSQVPIFGKLPIVCTFVLIVVISVPMLANGQTRMGIAGTVGAGLFVASDKEYYGGISTDLYPEVGIQLDVSMIRLGLKFAYIYRKVELYMWGWDGNSYWDYYYEYTLSYLPVQAEFLIAPLSGQEISPYAGLMVGLFIATGDNEDHLPALSPKLGLEANLEPLLVYGDIRYTYAPHGDADANAGGFMLVLGMGIRLGLSK